MLSLVALQVSVLVRRRMLYNVRCQLTLLCVLSETVTQLIADRHMQATVLYDVINLVELSLGSVAADKVSSQSETLARRNRYENT